MEERLFEQLDKLLDEGKVIDVFQGRMEFGPRALGNRSIIVDARSDTMQVKLNQKIKFRESFRPFVPAVLRENVAEYFELEEDSLYMLLIENAKESRRKQTNVKEELRKADYDMLQVVKQKRSDIPAVAHVDHSARIQTVSKEKKRIFL